MKLLQAFRGYRTLIINLIAIVVALLVAAGILPASEFAGVTPEAVGENFDKVAQSVDALIAAVVALLAVINGILRFLTKGSVGQKVV